jgi:putative membrane protein
MTGPAIAAAGLPSAVRTLTTWQPTAPVLVLCVLAAVLYALAVAHRERPWPQRRTAAFAIGLLTVIVALDSGVDVYAAQLVSVHMIQHLMLTLVAAPLLAAGAPVRLALGATHGSARRRLAGALGSPPVRVLVHPWSAWLLFVGFIVGWHLSPLYDLSARDALLHELEHVLLLTAGVLFWMQVVRADPLPHGLGPVGRLLYLLGAMPAMSIIGIWLVIAHTPRYPAYAAAASQLGVSSLYDEHVAGVIMWGGDALIGAVTLVLTCGALLHEERRTAARQAYGESGRTMAVDVGGGR